MTTLTSTELVRDLAILDALRNRRRRVAIYQHFGVTQGIVSQIIERWGNHIPDRSQVQYAIHWQDGHCPRCGIVTGAAVKVENWHLIEWPDLCDDCYMMLKLGWRSTCDELDDSVLARLGVLDVARQPLPVSVTSCLRWSGLLSDALGKVISVAEVVG